MPLTPKQAYEQQIILETSSDAGYLIIPTPSEKLPDPEHVLMQLKLLELEEKLKKAEDLTVRQNAALIEQDKVLHAYKEKIEGQVIQNNMLTLENNHLRGKLEEATQFNLTLLNGINPNTEHTSLASYQQMLQTTRNLNEVTRLLNNAPQHQFHY